jgi:hypothetical protein
MPARRHWRAAVGEVSVGAAVLVRLCWSGGAGRGEIATRVTGGYLTRSSFSGDRLACNSRRYWILVEWRVTDMPRIQLCHDPDRAGSRLLNFGVDDWDTHVAELAGRGLILGSIETVNKSVRASTVVEPAGNRIPSSAVSERLLIDKPYGPPPPPAWRRTA